MNEEFQVWIQGQGHQRLYHSIAGYYEACGFKRGEAYRLAEACFPVGQAPLRLVAVNAEDRIASRKASLAALSGRGEATWDERAEWVFHNVELDEDMAKLDECPDAGTLGWYRMLRGNAGARQKFYELLGSKAVDLMRKRDAESYADDGRSLEEVIRGCLAAVG